MQTPAGGEFIEGKFIVHDYFQAMFNPFMRTSVLHMFFATLETSLFVIGGISAWYILKARNQAFFYAVVQNCFGLCDRRCTHPNLRRPYQRRTGLSLSAD